MKPIDCAPYSPLFLVFPVLAGWLTCLSAMVQGSEFAKPTITVGDANCFGELQFTGHLGVIKISQGEVYDFYYTYSSNPDYDSPHFGKGFFVPLLESTLVDNDYFLEITTIGGASIYLYRLPAEPDSYVSLNGKDTAKKFGDHRYIRETKEGFTFEYRLGRLFRARAPSGVGLEFEYEGGICRTVRTSSGGNVFTFSKRSETDAVITTAGGSFQLSYQVHPESRRVNDSPGTLYTLKSIGWPDGQESLFEYPEEEGGGDMILRMSYGGASADYRWNRFTGRLKYADGATYEIEPLERAEDFEEERPRAGSYRINRTFQDGTWKSFFFDLEAGYSDSRVSGGPIIRNHYINSRGPVYNLLRRREQILDGDPELLYEAFYDPEGNLIREVSKGKVTWYLRENGLDKSVVKTGDNVVQFDKENRVCFSRRDGSSHYSEWKANGSRRMISRHPWGEIMLQYFDSSGNPAAIPPGEKFPERNSF